MSDLVSRVIPTLVSPVPDEFSVFDVMHHGTHEKQTSNVFAWLLRAEGSRRLNDRFLRCFLDEVNARGGHHVARQRFVVSQEQNVRSERKGADIADIVLRGEDTTVVIENYYVSDGHGHDYGAYRTYGEGEQIVVMLCALEDTSRLTDGWEKSTVITYSNLLQRLFDDIGADLVYQRAYPDQYGFLCQMKRHFTKGRLVNDDSSLEFIKVLCETGAAERFGWRNGASSFAEFVGDEAGKKFEESQALLNRLKKTLQNYLKANLGRLNAALGEEFFTGTNIRFAGIYQWDVSLLSAGERTVFVLFGPSAWADNETNAYGSWDTRVENADYSRLLIGYGKTRVLQQSAVSMAEVLDGLAPEDTRLLDEIVSIVRG